MKWRADQLFEYVLWNSRLVVLLAVVASLAVALVMFYIATVDVVYLIGEIAHYAQLAAAERSRVHAVTVGHVAQIVDGYLFATIMVIFALGLYELFISKIDIAEDSETASSVLIIRDLDELKERLAKVVFLILVVRYFEYALQSPMTDSRDLLFLAIGIVLIALALYLTATKRYLPGEPHIAGPSER